MGQLFKKQSDNIEKVILSQKELARTNTNIVFDLQTSNENLFEANARIATLDAKLFIMEAYSVNTLFNK